MYFSPIIFILIPFYKNTECNFVGGWSLHFFVIDSNIMFKVSILSLFLFFHYFTYAQNKISLLFAGDAMGHATQHTWAYNAENKKYSYNRCYDYIKKYVEYADLAFVNLEVTLAGEPYTGYPTFSSPDTFLSALQYAGFDVIALANNHILDKGKKGLEQTITKIKQHNLQYVGVYKDSLERINNYPLCIDVEGVKLAVFNYTSMTNGIKVKSPNHVNYIDKNEIIRDLEKIKNQNVNLKIIFLHWGEEYQLSANNTQKELSQFLVEQGFDIIIGSHPHVVQNFEFLIDSTGKKVPVYYSLGNFISNQRQKNCDGGIMAYLEIDKNIKAITLATYIPFYVYKGTLEAQKQFYLIPTQEYAIKYQNYPIAKADSTLLYSFEYETKNRLSNIKPFDIDKFTSIYNSFVRDTLNRLTLDTFNHHLQTPTSP